MEGWVLFYVPQWLAVVVCERSDSGFSILCKSRCLLSYLKFSSFLFPFCYEIILASEVGVIDIFKGGIIR